MMGRKSGQIGMLMVDVGSMIPICIESGLVDGNAMAADGSYLPSNVFRNSWVDIELEVEKSMQSYLNRLDEELAEQPGFKKPPAQIVKKSYTISTTDPDCGYINHGNKCGIGYLMEATVDCKHGILTGVRSRCVRCQPKRKPSGSAAFGASDTIRCSNETDRFGSGYDTGAVHRGLELLGITGYIPTIQFSNAPEKYGFFYAQQEDAFVCPEGKLLRYHKLYCNKSTGKYLRNYQTAEQDCQFCPRRSSCLDKISTRRRILASSCYPAFFRGHARVGTPKYLSMMQLRKIWAEGSFSVMKREHCLSKIRKRGISAAIEECLLSAMALNLKRMAKATFFAIIFFLTEAEFEILNFGLAFVNRSLILPYQPPLINTMLIPLRYESGKACRLLCTDNKPLRLFQFTFHLGFGRKLCSFPILRT